MKDGVITEETKEEYIKQMFQILTYSINQPIRSTQ